MSESEQHTANLTASVQNAHTTAEQLAGHIRYEANHCCQDIDSQARLSELQAHADGLTNHLGEIARYLEVSHANTA